MAKKIDLESAYREYSALCKRATESEANADFVRTLSTAKASLPFLNDAIAFLRRYQKVEAPLLISISLILRYAPVMFARGELEAVERWYSETKRNDKKTYLDVPDRLEAAWQKFRLAIRIWPTWRMQHPTIANQEEAIWMTEMMDFWIQVGAVIRSQTNQQASYQLVTHPLRPVQGKCRQCGKLDQAAMVEFLATKTCTHCHAISEFIVLNRMG